MRQKRHTGCDTMKAQRRNRALILAILTIFVMMLSVSVLFGCNQEYDGDREYGVYVQRVEYDVYRDNPNYDDGVVYMRVYLGLTANDDKKIDGVTANWHYEKRKVNAFKFEYTYRLEIDGSIFSAAVDSLTQEQLTYEGTEYNIFEVYFEYATIYKSMKGNIDHRKTDSGYAFDFPINETQTLFETTFTIPTQNSASYYGILIAVACVAAGVVIAVVFTRRKKYAERH